MEAFPEKIDLWGWLSRCLKLLGRYWPLVPALAALLSGLLYLQARRSFVPRYEAVALISIGAEEPNSPEGADPLAVSAFPGMLETELMEDLILERLGTDRINGTITPYRFRNTGLFQLSVSGTDPEDAYDILQAVLDAYPQAMAHTMTRPEIQIRRAPVIPAVPCNAFDPGRPLVRGCVLGLVLGLGLIGLLALPGRTVRREGDLVALSGLPLLGSIPRVRQKKKPDCRDDPAMEEALRNLRTRLRAEGDPRVLLLTSALPGEGRSTLARNLAQSLESEDRQVALIAGDLRGQELSLLKEKYDHVILDGAPCTRIYQISQLLPQVDGVLLVVRWDYARVHQVQRTLANLTDYDAPLLGTVFVGIHRKS